MIKHVCPLLLKKTIRITHPVTTTPKKIIEAKKNQSKVERLSETEDNENVPLVPRKRKANAQKQASPVSQPTLRWECR